MSKLYLPIRKSLVQELMALVDGEPDGPPYTLRKKYAAAMCAPMPGGAIDPDIDAICGGALMSVSSWDVSAHHLSAPHFGSVERWKCMPFVGL